MKNQNFKKNKKQKGFVLLFAVLISTLVLAVGISMISIALKQVVLSGSGRDSQYAFYAANTGAECATYWDLASSSVFTSPGIVPGVDIACLGNPLASTWSLNNSGIEIKGSLKNNSTCNTDISSEPSWCFDGSTDPDKTSSAKFRIAYSNKPYCADVIVKKEWNSEGLVGTTTVTSRGYNTCDSTNPRRIERALEFSY